MPGFNNGPASSASFNVPYAVATDSAGNVYIGDGGNYAIRKIAPDGTTSTLAGSGVAGRADGVGSAASFASPAGLAVDSAGNVYVADTGNNEIRKITPDGTVSTLAGSPLPSYADGTGTAASFFYPSAIAVDASGNIYVADQGNFVIRKITPGGVVSTIVGAHGVRGSVDGVGSAAEFNDVAGMTIDGSGNLYVTEQENNATDGAVVRKISSTGVVTTLAGSVTTSGTADGTGSAARFYFPAEISVDQAGNLYVADSNNYVIRKITPANVVTTFAGTDHMEGGANGPAATALFNLPTGIAIDPTGNLYVADRNNNAIRKIDTSGTVSAFSGQAPEYQIAPDWASTLFQPCSMTHDTSGNLYLVDCGRGVVYKVTPSGTISALAGTAGITGFTNGQGAAASFQFSGTSGIAVDAAGNVYVSDSINNVIRKITPAGLVTTFAGSGVDGYVDGSAGSAQFSGPAGLVFDAAGNLYVVDSLNSVVRKITPAGIVSTFAGNGVSNNIDGTGTAASFDIPNGITIDSAGNLYVTQTIYCNIRKITPAGVVTTFATPDTNNISSSRNEPLFYGPEGIATDPAGNVFVADYGDDAVYVFSPSGVITTIAGVVGKNGVTMGALPGQLSKPVGLTYYSGQLYIQTLQGIVALSNVQ